MARVPEEGPLPPSLRFLKGLVIALMVTMIAGVITLVALLVTRLPGGNAAPALPPGLALPAGESVEAVTFGKGWTVIVSESGRIYIFDTRGTLRQELLLDPSATE